jgi:hypothetical protein
MAKNEGYPGANEGKRHETGEKEPKGAGASDRGGERHEGMKNGVAMGKMDATGDNKEFNTGKTEGTCYSHKRIPHPQKV